MPWLRRVCFASLLCGCSRAERPLPSPFDAGSDRSTTVVPDEDCPAGAKLELRNVPGGKPALIEIGFRNCSAARLWVNHRLAVAAEGDRFRDNEEVKFLIVGPSGVSRFGCMVGSTPPSASDYGILMPGKRFGLKWIVSTCFDMKVPGDYRVSARYQDKWLLPSSPPPGARHLTAELRSNVLEVRIPARESVEVPPK
jgi:hypothetical protein